MIRRVILLISFTFLFLVFLNPTEGIAAPEPDETIITSYLINYPCANVSIDVGAAPVRFNCLGSTEILSGRAATITFPTPRITARVPKLSIVAIPTFLNLSWDSASFSYSDVITPEFEYSMAGEDYKLVNVHYELRVTPVEYKPIDIEQYEINLGNIKIQNPSYKSVNFSFIENREDVYRTILSPFCDPKNDQLLSNIPAEQGGFDYRGGGCENLIRLLPQPETVQPASVDGYNFSDFPYGIDGQVLAYWSQFASTQGTSRTGSHPVFELTFISYWQVEAKVSWEKHLIRDVDSNGGEEIIDCRWEYWEDPDAYIDWTQYPPFCKKIVYASEGWVEHCNPGSETSGKTNICKYVEYFGSSDEWWRTIGTYEVPIVLTPDGEYTDRYSFVVLQAQPLLDAP